MNQFTFMPIIERRGLSVSAPSADRIGNATGGGLPLTPEGEGGSYPQYRRRWRLVSAPFQSKQELWKGRPPMTDIVEIGARRAAKATEFQALRIHFDNLLECTTMIASAMEQMWDFADRAEIVKTLRLAADKLEHPED